MSKRGKYYLAGIFIFSFAVLILGSSVSAHATAALKLHDGTYSLTIADGDGNDASSETGVVVFTGKINANSVWTLNVTTGTTMPFNGSSTVPAMTLDTINAESNSMATETLDVWFSEVGFGPLDSSVTGFKTDVSATPADKISFASYYDDTTNTRFNPDTILSSFGPYTTSNVSDTDTTLTTPSDPFSLTAHITIEHKAGVGFQLTQSDMKIVAVPEPVSSTLFIIGSATLGFRHFRRKK